VRYRAVDEVLVEVAVLVPVGESGRGMSLAPGSLWQRVTSVTAGISQGVVAIVLLASRCNDASGRPSSCAGKAAGAAVVPSAVGSV
jgi:hypothetical protein